MPATINNAITKDVGGQHLLSIRIAAGRRRPQPSPTESYSSRPAMVSSVAASKRGTFDRQQWLNAEAPAELQGCSQSNLRYRQMTMATISTSERGHSRT